MAELHEPPFVVVAASDAEDLGRLRSALRLAGAQVAACRTVKVSLESLTFHLPDVVALAPEMEEGRGWDVLYAARGRTQAAIVVLDRDPTGVTRRAAFAAGAADVLELTRDDAELATRIVSLAARARNEGGGTVYRHRGLVMDVAAHTVRLHDKLLILTAQQFAILRALFEAKGATLTREGLLGRIESLDVEPPSDRAIDLHVARLRRRLGDDAHTPRWVESVYGIGYRLAIGPASAGSFDGEAEHVLDALPDPLLVLDAEQCIRFANDAATRFLERPRGEIVGQRCGDILRCHDCVGHSLAGSRCFSRAVAGRDTTLRDVPADIEVSGDRVPVRFTYARVRGDGLLTLQIRPRTAG